MTKNNEDVLLSGTLRKAMGEEGNLETEMQHLTCFIGGVLALAGKTFQRDEDVKDGARLARGCVWAYKSTATGIMPETFTALACKNRASCPWNETNWWEAVSPGSPEEELQLKLKDERLPKGFTRIQDRRYLLRYVAISSPQVRFSLTESQTGSHRVSIHSPSHNRRQVLVSGRLGHVPSNPEAHQSPHRSFSNRRRDQLRSSQGERDGVVLAGGDLEVLLPPIQRSRCYQPG
jgi:hypothetical protein